MTIIDRRRLLLLGHELACPTLGSSYFCWDTAGQGLEDEDDDPHSHLEMQDTSLGCDPEPASLPKLPPRFVIRPGIFAACWHAGSSRFVRVVGNRIWTDHLYAREKNERLL